MDIPPLPLISRLTAALSDRYRIERELGAGGMATVYLAHDLKHHRQVAIKVLKPELAAVVGADRFLAEIRTTANLQHPNILPLFDSGEADSFLFYVMPYVEGESLRERLDRERQLPVEEAVRIATEVGEALDYAHRQGIIHRDIKPANILLREGRPLIADFGIALAVTAAGAGRLTETGLSLGTPYYMSPEQATADRDPGPQSDVYSLGCVLYEMLAGEPPFTGSSAQAVLGKIITGDPLPPSSHRATVPAHVDWVVLKSIAKLPADRFPSTGRMTQALSDPTVAAAARGGGPEGAGHGRGPGRIERLVWIGAVAVAVVGGALWSGRRGAEDAEPAIVRMSIQLPDSIPMAFIGAATLGNGRRAFAVSEDGATLVYVGLRDGVARLYVRAMNAFEIEELPGTEDAYGPFFSPNGRWVGFFVGNQLKKVRIDGGEPIVVAEATNSVGADWSEDGRIVFSDDEGGGLRVVSDQGGRVQDLGSAYPDSTDFGWPQWLPGANRIIAGGVLLDLAEGVATSIVGDDRHLAYLPAGYMVDMTGATLSVSRFDGNQGRATSPRVPVLSGIRGEIYGQGQWDVTPGGTLVYAEGGSLNEGPLAWVESDGSRTHLDLPVRERGTFELSPTGDRLAVEEYDAGGSHVWIYELASGRREQVTVEPGASRPLDWSPDGLEILYNRYEPFRVGFIQPVSSGSRARRAFPEMDSITSAYSWSPGGTLLGVGMRDPAGVGVADLSSQTVERVSSDDTSWGLVLSPTGDAVAYTSALTGEYQNYVEPYPPTGERIQVSITGGAEEPRWSEDGQRLYYRSGRRIMVADVGRAPALSVGSPRVVYEGDFVNVGGRSFDVTSDEARFLVIDDPVVTTTTLKVVQGWTTEVERLLREAGGAEN
ncbi:MAG: serine/threonine-protein kinase [Gemmatimonadales bacterium]|nr:MAG: serine/threonine-protein kinase [Gemmatimonadales bacterium]